MLILSAQKRRMTKQCWIPRCCIYICRL